MKRPRKTVTATRTPQHESRQLASVLIACMSLSFPAQVSHAQVSADDMPTRAEELFAVEILGVFQEKCFVCHGDDAEDVQGDFNMLSRDGLLRGGESEQPAVVPGQPDESPLFHAINWDGLEMPPKANDRLTAEQIALIGEWIEAGAPWPDQATVRQLQEAARASLSEGDETLVKTSGGLSDAWTNRTYDPENLWAYQPLWRDPHGELERSSLHPVDVLIGQRLQTLELDPAPPADRRTLLRRATFDLLGLPPTPADVAAFLADEDPDQKAFAKVVERLLASPHYGEQWGRHWLDVVRYADSSGYANDFERGNAWRYRDYVVRAFNEDKPYDQFVREQLAGDEIDSGNPELLVAAGFLRMGPWELTSMEVPKVARQRFLDDVTDAVGQVFLGHMLQCARCHDHKFDPVPTADYYSMQAIFATTQLAERKAPFLASENLDGFEEEAVLRARKKQYQQQLDELNKKQTIEAAASGCRNADAIRDPSTPSSARLLRLART